MKMHTHTHTCTDGAVERREKKGKESGRKGNAVVDGSYKKRQGDQSEGVCGGGLIPGGRTPKWETGQLGAALS